MAFYDLECSCGAVTEFMMGMEEVDAVVGCPECDEPLSRRHNNVFSVPAIQGETCSHSCSYGGYDEGLGEFVTDKKHRSELMKKKGLTEYNPDLSMKKHRDEARYIRTTCKPGCPEARAAISKEYKTATDKRRERNVRASMEKSFRESDSQ